jgi:hypothetical protein
MCSGCVRYSEMTIQEAYRVLSTPVACACAGWSELCGPPCYCVRLNNQATAVVRGTKITLNMMKDVT